MLIIVNNLTDALDPSEVAVGTYAAVLRAVVSISGNCLLDGIHHGRTIVFVYALHGGLEGFVERARC